MEDLEDNQIYMKLFPKDTYRSYPFVKNLSLDEKLSQLIEWVCETTNWLVRPDDIEIYRNSFIDFLYLFQYFHNLVHFQSGNVDEVFKSIKDFNSEYFWTVTNMNDMKHIRRFLKTQSINRNCYTELYFNSKKVNEDLINNTHFLRLYSSLVRFNNNPNFRKFKDNLELFHNSIKHFEDEDHERVEDHINASNINGEKYMLTRQLMWVAIDNCCLGRLFKVYKLNQKDCDFFMLMNIAFKNFLFNNSGINSISTLQNMLDIINPDILEETVQNFLMSISDQWLKPNSYRGVWSHNSIKFCSLTRDLRGRGIMAKSMQRLCDKKIC